MKLKEPKPKKPFAIIFDVLIVQIWQDLCRYQRENTPALKKNPGKTFFINVKKKKLLHKFKKKKQSSLARRFCKTKKKQNKRSNLWFFLVLTKDRNNFETKMSVIQTSELKIHQVQNIRWQLLFEKLKKSKELRYAESFLKCLNFQYEKFIF